MMHRYVALIATTSDGSGYRAAAARLGARLSSWSRLLDTRWASVWQFVRPPSRLGGWAAGPDACVVGRMFGERAAVETALRSGDAASILSLTWGAYVAVKVDEERCQVSICRDPTGRIEAWRMSLPGADIIFSHYDDVHDLRRGGLDINWDYIAYHLNNNWIRGRETALKGVAEVLPGEALVYAAGEPQAHLRWCPDAFVRAPYRSSAEASAAIRSAAEAAVGCWGSCYDSIALDLSGGLDSAIVLGLLRRHAPSAAVTGVNYVVPHAEGDERSFAHDAAAMHGAPLIEQEVSVHTVREAPSFARRLMRPTIKAFPVGYQELGGQVAQRLGVEAIFSGTGGDHLFFDHLGVLAAADYRRRNGVGRGFVRVSHLLAQVSGDTIWNAFAAAARDARSPLPRPRDLLQGNNPFLTDPARAAADYERFTHPWVTLALDAAPAKRQQILNLCELQRHYIRYGRADIAEETHPLYAQPLMEACLRTPAYWFVAGGLPRGFAREIFADILPPSIRLRRTKGVNTSHWYQIMRRELAWMRELLLDGRLVSQGLLDKARLEAALSPSGLVTTDRFSPLVNCVTTEAWVRQAEIDHSSGRSPTPRDLTLV